MEPLGNHLLRQKRKDLSIKKFYFFTLKTLPDVNFTNILSAFAPNSFHQKITNPNFKHIKGAQGTLA
jgi:hypothetical protein